MRASFLSASFLIASLSWATNALGAEDAFTFGIVTRSEIDEVATANGFCRGQKMTSQALGGVSPAKAAALDLELARFGRATGDGCTELERALKTYLEGLAPSKDVPGKAWTSYSSTVDRGLTDQLRKVYPHGYNEVAADQFAGELSGRRKGKMDQEILGTILSASREYRRYPELEIVRGFGEIFSTAGLPKARDIRVQLKVPVSWKGKDGDGPHVVQKWTSRIDASGAFAMLILMALPASSADMADIRREFSAGILSDELQQLLPSGGVVEGTDRIQLMFKPALRATFLLRSQAVDKVFVQKNFLYLALTDRGVLSLQCGVGTSGDSSGIATLLERYRKLCDLVATSMLDLSHLPK